jgi:hypothetical protein
METSVIFIALSLWLALFVLLPVFHERAEAAASGERLPPGFRAEIGSLLAGLRDLEYDAQTGKLGPEDLESMRSQMQTRLVDTIRWAGYEARFLDAEGAPLFELLAPLEIE